MGCANAKSKNVQEVQHKSKEPIILTAIAISAEVKAQQEIKTKEELQQQPATPIKSTGTPPQPEYYNEQQQPQPNNQVQFNSQSQGASELLPQEHSEAVKQKQVITHKKSPQHNDRIWAHLEQQARALALNAKNKPSPLPSNTAIGIQQSQGSNFSVPYNDFIIERQFKVEEHSVIEEGSEVVLQIQEKPHVQNKVPARVTGSLAVQSSIVNVAMPFSSSTRRSHNQNDSNVVVLEELRKPFHVKTRKPVVK